MPAMSSVESLFCRTTVWRWFARRHVTPWALDHHRVLGDVLEIGSGSGAMAAELHRLEPGITLTATDIDPAMVAAMRERLGDEVRVEQADSTALPFADASYDRVVSWLMLHHIGDWETAVAEAGRVLRPNGEFLGYDITDTRVAYWVHTLDRSPFRLVDPERLRSVLTDAGFVDIEIDTAFGKYLMRFRARRS